MPVCAPRGYKYTQHFTVLSVPHVEALLAFVTPTLSCHVTREVSGYLYFCQQTTLGSASAAPKTLISHA